jgi:molybdopterin synthase catalytic subunit
MTVRIQTEAFDPAQEWRALQVSLDGRAGAVTTFVGLVRERFGEGAVGALELEHYPGMTEKSIEGIIREAQRRWPLLAVAVVHRVGALAPSDPIVFVGVAAAHRPAAFAACEFVMDYLKTEAVFWKRERLTDASGTSSRWVQSSADDHARARAWRDHGNRESAAPEPPRD